MPISFAGPLDLRGAVVSVRSAGAAVEAGAGGGAAGVDAMVVGSSPLRVVDDVLRPVVEVEVVSP